MTERSPDNDDSFDARWNALAKELEESLPSDLAFPGDRPSRSEPPRGHVVHPAQPAELDDPDDDELGAGPLAPAGPRDWEAGPQVEEHFEPPDPPPVLDGNPAVILGWVFALGGFLGMFAWAAMRDTWSVWLGRGALAALVAGIAILVWRMPHRRDPDDHDNGAQV